MATQPTVSDDLSYQDYINYINWIYNNKLANYSEEELAVAQSIINRLSMAFINKNKEEADNIIAEARQAGFSNQDILHFRNAADHNFYNHVINTGESKYNHEQLYERNKDRTKGAISTHKSLSDSLNTALANASDNDDTPIMLDRSPVLQGLLEGVSEKEKAKIISRPNLNNPIHRQIYAEFIKQQLEQQVNDPVQFAQLKQQAERIKRNEYLNRNSVHQRAMVDSDNLKQSPYKLVPTKHGTYTIVDENTGLPIGRNKVKQQPLLRGLHPEGSHVRHLWASPGFTRYAPVSDSHNLLYDFDYQVGLDHARTPGVISIPTVKDSKGNVLSNPFDIYLFYHQRALLYQAAMLDYNDKDLLPSEGLGSLNGVPQQGKILKDRYRQSMVNNSLGTLAPLEAYIMSVQQQNPGIQITPEILENIKQHYLPLSRPVSGIDQLQVVATDGVSQKYPEGLTNIVYDPKNKSYHVIPTPAISVATNRRIQGDFEKQKNSSAEKARLLNAFITPKDKLSTAQQQLLRTASNSADPGILIDAVQSIVSPQQASQLNTLREQQQAGQLNGDNLIQGIFDVINQEQNANFTINGTFNPTTETLANRVDRDLQIYLQHGRDSALDYRDAVAMLEPDINKFSNHNLGSLRTGELSQLESRGGVVGWINDTLYPTFKRDVRNAPTADFNRIWSYAYGVPLHTSGMGDHAYFGKYGKGGKALGPGFISNTLNTLSVSPLAASYINTKNNAALEDDINSRLSFYTSPFAKDIALQDSALITNNATGYPEHLNGYLNFANEAINFGGTVYLGGTAAKGALGAKSAVPAQNLSKTLAKNTALPAGKAATPMLLNKPIINAATPYIGPAIGAGAGFVEFTPEGNVTFNYDNGTKNIAGNWVSGNSFKNIVRLGLPKIFHESNVTDTRYQKTLRPDLYAQVVGYPSATTVSTIPMDIANKAEKEKAKADAAAKAKAEAASKTEGQAAGKSPGTTLNTGNNDYWKPLLMGAGLGVGALGLYSLLRKKKKKKKKKNRNNVYMQDDYNYPMYGQPNYNQYRNNIYNSY